MVGTGCEHDGVIYRNGQSFSPSCKYQCVCVNGAIGCVSLCTESQPPRVWCQTPRRVKVRGQCCEKWICDEPKRGRKTAPRHAVETPPAETRSWHKNCISQTTSWSPCSKTCGRGLSMRISNANDQCELVKESRLCNLRPCEVDITKHIKPGKKCLNIYREDQPSNLTISGCTSKKLYRPKYCGVCTDERCCIPYKSKTIDVDFECPNGSGFTWKMLWVQACFCNLSCKNPNDIFAELESYYGYPEVMNWEQLSIRLPHFFSSPLFFPFGLYILCLSVRERLLFFLLEKSVNIKCKCVPRTDSWVCCAFDKYLKNFAHKKRISGSVKYWRPYLFMEFFFT